MAAPYKVYAARLKVRMTKEMREQLDARAVLDGTTPTQLVRDVLTAYLNTSTTPEPKRVA